MSTLGKGILADLVDGYGRTSATHDVGYATSEYGSLMGDVVSDYSQIA